MAATERLRFALTHLTSTDWGAFEQLASTFMAADFSELRTIAGTGDEGRDAVFESADNPQIVVQYSIVEDWPSKIKRTLKRLAEVGHPCAGLVYVTNRDVGAKGQALRSELLRGGVMLDVRDRSFFLDRVNASLAQAEAAEEFADRIVNPLLPGQELVRNSVVTNPDLRAGLLYLELQLHDADEGRNIAKLSYDALVLGALRETGPDHELTRGEILSAIKRVLPDRDPSVIEAAVSGCLERLRNRRRINVTRATDSFSLRHEERIAQSERALRLLDQHDAVRKQLDELARSSAMDLEIPYPELGSDAFVDMLLQLFERMLERQGNQFAEAVRQQTGLQLRHDVLARAQDEVTRHARDLHSLRVPREPLIELATEVATNAFIVGGAIRTHLRELADAYTLLAFMQQAPDVQRAVSEFFSRGRLVLDTSVLLPCFAESLLPDDDQLYTNVLRGARDAGIELSTTEGVLNEIDAHLDLSLLRHRLGAGTWRGSTPLVYSQWLDITGGGDFASFVQRFRGDGGIEDVQLFVEQALNVTLADLALFAERTDDQQRYAIAELWRPRKLMRPTGSEIERDIRLRHDIEMYFGVLAWRRNERRDLYGYEAWWVTGDSSALRMFDLAKDEGIDLPSNPTMSPAFLTNMLSIGPSRNRIRRDIRDQLPVALDLHRSSDAIAGLSTLADEIRAEHAQDPEWLIRRRIRDKMNELKRLQSDIDLPITEVVNVPAGSDAV
jgi:hypothetical protein